MDFLLKLSDAGGEATPSWSWVPLDVDWFDDARDINGNLTGLITDDGAGRVTVPHASPGSIQDLRDAALLTAPLSVLAAALGTTTTAILDGSVTVVVRVSDPDVTGKNGVACAVCLLDTTAASAGAAYGVGVGITRLNGKLGGGAVKEATNTNTNNLPADATQYVIGRLRCIEEGGTNKVDAQAAFYTVDDNGIPNEYDVVDFGQTNASMGVISHFGFCCYFEASSSEIAADHIATWELAAVPTADLAFAP